MNQLIGLSSKEALKRLEKYGPNEIERKKQLPWLRLLLDQFKSPLIYILFFAGLITLILKEWTDALVIFLAVGVNTILGFIQEYKAEKSLIALRKILVSHAKVIRDGKEELIETKDIVPGDLVILSTGSKVPADGVVVEGISLHLNEAILTGESVPVEKKEIKSKKVQNSSNISPEDLKSSGVFMGTVVVSGRGKMLVTKTGMKTKMGGIAGQLKETIEEETPLKKQIGYLSKILAIIFAFVCLIIFFEGLWREREILEMFTLSVAVAVAAIPEGLVVSLTVILSLGMQRVLKRKGLVRKLLAAETLGSVDIICADKTGTLTEGKMKVTDWETEKGSKSEEEEILKAAALCNNMTNPLEVAMINWVREEVGEVEEIIKLNPRIDEIPFSSEKKFIAVLVKSPPDTSGVSRGKIFLSGAPEMVMEMCLMTEKEKIKWQKKLDEFTKKGLRVVAFSYATGDLKKLKTNFLNLKKGLQKYDGQINGDWHYLQLKWLGLLLFEDPVRLEVKQALKTARLAGIKIKVITGDYRNTAISVLNKLEINGGQLKDEQVMEGWELEKASDEELTKRIDEIVLFARTTPEQKIRIVEALQAKGHSVAMMGDGVNDALALKKADIGIVVGEASEVAKETADMVLLDSNFKTVVAAVEEGRGIFENIKKVVLYLLSDSFTEIVLIGGSLLLGLPTPLLSAQILWVNLVEDGLPGLALAFEPKDKGLMKEPPRPKNAPILDEELKILIFVIGIITDFLLFTIFYLLFRFKLPIEMTRTIIFAALAVDSLLYVFSCKTLRVNLWHEDIFSNKFLLFSVLIGFLLLIAGIYTPFLNLILKTERLPLLAWPLIFTKGLITIGGIELVKWFFLKKENL